MHIKIKSPQNSSKFSAHFEHSVMQEININNLFIQTQHHLETADGIKNHIYSLIRQVIRSYIDIRNSHYITKFNIEERGLSIRQTSNKLVLFKN